MRIALYEKKEVKITLTFHKIAGYIFQFYYLFEEEVFSTLNPLSLSLTFTFHWIKEYLCIALVGDLRSGERVFPIFPLGINQPSGKVPTLSNQHLFEP